MTALAPISLVMATYLEAKPFVEKIDWERSSDFPFPAYHGRDFSLVISGMGKANAAAACAWICTALAPACIVNIGAAGANCKDMPIGSIHHICEAVEYDRHDIRTGSGFRHQPRILTGFATARVATQDKPVIDLQQRRRISSAAELSDMEGAAVIQIARRFQTPCFLFKFVSDTPDHTTGREIVAHIRQQRQALFEYFMHRVLPELRRDGPEHTEVGQA